MYFLFENTNMREHIEDLITAKAPLSTFPPHRRIFYQGLYAVLLFYPFSLWNSKPIFLFILI